MEHVTTNEPNALYILNGQEFLIRKESEYSSFVTSDMNSGALHSNSVEPNSDNSMSTSISSGKNYVILNNAQTDDERVVQLSIRDDFPLELVSSSTIKNEITNCNVFKNILTSADIKCDTFSSPELLDTFLKLPPKENLGEQIELGSPLKGNYTYAYQLSDGSKLCSVSQNVREIINASNTDVSSKPNEVTANGISIGSMVSQSSSPLNGRKLVYVNKILGGVSLKPHIILNMKSKTAVEQKKRITQKIQILPTSGKSIFVKSSSQKPVTPAANRITQKDSNSMCELNNHSLEDSLSTSSNCTLKNEISKKFEVGSNEVISGSHLVQTEAPKQPSLLQQQLHKERSDQIINVSSTTKDNLSSNESKAVGRLTESQLKKIAAVFQNGCINHSRLTNSTIYDNETNTRIVCRVVYPEDLIKNGEKKITKRGKKRTRPVDVVKKSAAEEEKNKKPAPPSARTRSGRLSRPPRYMVKDFKKLTEDSEASYSDYRSDSDENTENTPFLHLPYHKQNKISSKYKCPTCNKVYLGKRRMLKHFSQLPDHEDSKTIYELENESLENKKQKEREKNMWKQILRKGARKPKLDSAALLKELFQACSNDTLISVAKDWISTNFEPWDFLKTRQLREGGGVASLLSDLSSLIKAIPSNLLQPAKPGDFNSIYIEDQKLCQLLNISPGYYLPDESSLGSDNGPKEPCNNDNTSSSSNLKCNNEPCWTERNSIYNEDFSKMDLEPTKIDTIDDVSKEVSSDLNEMLLEKSSLESVDQIVSERLNDLIPTSPLDVNSLVEAQVLARSMLASSPDLLRGVSGSTEDLMKTLENLTPDLPADSTSADFDFTVLSSEFSSER